MNRRGVVAAAGLVLAAATLLALLALQDRGFDWNLPDGVPPPPVPADNPMSELKVSLGRRLFHDPRLSVNGTTACATCHRQQLAFTDGRARAVGATGEVHPRGSMTLVNVAYASRLMWSNHLLDSLEVQALTPMFGEEPVEMGMAGRESEIVAMLKTDPFYREAFPQAFSSDSNPYSILNLVRSVSSFVRSIVSFQSPYDRYLRGDESALEAAQLRGMELFFSERLECFHCHGGFNFTDSSTHADSIVASFGFHNTGLYNIGGTGAYPPDNTGLHDLTGARRDMGRFKAPTLRNVAITAPYMHDGSMQTLREVVDHYARGGRAITGGPYAGDGRRNPYKSEFVRGFGLTAREKADLIAFLESLTDPSVLEDPRYADPCLPTANEAENCVSRPYWPGQQPISMKSEPASAAARLAHPLEQVDQFDDFRALVGQRSGFQCSVDAFAGVRPQNLGLRLFQCGFYGLDLLQDVDAIAVLFNHPAEAPDLPFDAVEAPFDREPRLFFLGHGTP